MTGVAPITYDFREVFEAHVGFVWRVLKRLGVPDRELEDASQEVFLVVHRRLLDFEARSSLRTWIYGIAVRVASSARRKIQAQRESPESFAPEAAHEPDPLSDLDRRTRMVRVEQALMILSEEKREAFALYELEHMTVAEVAQAVGVPENTALYRLHAARDEIRAYVMRSEAVGAAQKAGEKRGQTHVKPA